MNIARGGLATRTTRLRELFFLIVSGRSASSILARDAFLTASLSVTGIAIGFVVNIALARALGVQQFGHYALALGWVDLLMIIATLGFPVTLLRFLPEYRALGAWGLFRGVLLRSLQLVGAATAVMALGGLLLVTLLWGRLGAELGLAFVVAILALPAVATMHLFESILRSLNRIVWARSLQNVVRPLLFLAMVSGAILLDREFSGAVAVGLNMSAVALAVVLAALLSYRALPHEARLASPRYATKEWLKVSTPLLATDQIRALTARLDLILIGVVLGPSTVAVFVIASRIAPLASLGLSTSSAVAAPLISELYAKRDFRELRRLVALSVWGATVTSLILAAGLALTHTWVLAAFGDEFQSASTVVLIMLLGNVVSSFFGPVNLLLGMTGQHNAFARITIAASLVRVVILTPAMLIGGINLALLIGVGIGLSRNLALWTVVRRHLQINSSVFGGIAPIMGRDGTENDG